MTMKNAIGPFLLGNPIHTVAAPSFISKAISTTSIAAGIFQVPKTGSIHKLSFYCSAFTSSGGTLDVRLETVSSTTGDPTGTLYGTNTSGTVTVNATGWFTATLTADASVTIGDIVAIVIKSTGGAAQSLSIGYFNSAVDGGGKFPYGDRFVASWLSHPDRPCMAAEYSDGSYAYIADMYPINAINNTAFNSSSTPDEVAAKLTLGVPVRIRGARVYVDGDNDFSVILYDTDGTTALQTKAWDKDWREVTEVTAGSYDIIFNTPQTLAYNGTYRLAVRPDTTSNISVVNFDFPSTAVLSQFDLYGTSIAYSQRTDAGAWSDTATRRLCVWPIIDGLDDGQTPGAGEHSYGNAG